MPKETLKIRTKAIRCFLLIAVGCFGLSACQPGDTFSLQSKPKVTSKVDAGGIALIMGGPRGYCVSDSQSRKTSAGSFTVFGYCQTGDVQVPKERRGLLVANVANSPQLGKLTNPADLTAALKSTKGRKSLSNSANPKTVEILDTRVKNSVVYIYTRDLVGPLIPDTTNEQWRGFFVVKGRLVSVSMVNFIDNAVGSETAYSQLVGFSNKIRQLNAVSN